MLNIVTALPSEAEPIIDHLALKALRTHCRPHIYGNDIVHLVIAGVGQGRSKQAIDQLARFNAEYNSPGYRAWINIGIAGHRNEKLGSCFIVDKIIEQQSGKTCYPSIPYRTALGSSLLCTVELPEEHYRENTLYDMEGFSFFSNAQRHTAHELIVLLKIVSDNEEHPLQRINKALVRTLIENALPALDETMTKLQSIIPLYIAPKTEPEIDWSRLWHATHSQQRILSERQQSLMLLDPKLDVLQLVAKCHSAQEAIRVMENIISQTPMRLAPAP